MTDQFRAMCAELVAIEDALSGGSVQFSNQGQALDGYSALATFRDVADRARALLAQPEPVIPVKQQIFPTPSQAAECGGPCYEGSYCPEACDCGLYQPPALAQPVAEGPTDEELLRVAATAIAPYEISGITPGEYEPETECAVEVYGSELIAYARAVLSRWGRPTPQPVPVSERLPGLENCDAEGRCWLGGHQLGNGTPTWLLGYPAWAKRFPDVHRFWLPANALPTPETTND